MRIRRMRLTCLQGLREVCQGQSSTPGRRLNGGGKHQQTIHSEESYNHWDDNLQEIVASLRCISSHVVYIPEIHLFVFKQYRVHFTHHIKHFRTHSHIHRTVSSVRGLNKQYIEMQIENTLLVRSRCALETVYSCLG